MYENEIWKPVVGYEGLYEVSNLGRIRSCDRIVKYSNGRIHNYKSVILKPNILNTGYKQVGLCKNGKQTNCSVHRLVAQAFIPNPNNLPVVNHINEIKTDNKAENLEWCTQKYNIYYSGIPDELHKLGTEATKKSVIQLTKNNEFVAEYESIMDVERKTKINHSNISMCCLNKKNYKTAGRI